MRLSRSQSISLALALAVVAVAVATGGCAGAPSDEGSAPILIPPIHRIPTGWNGGWDPLGGIALSDPSLVSVSDGRYDAFVYGTDHKLYQNTSLGGTWGGWQKLDSPAALVGKPVAVAVRGRIAVFVRYASDLSLHGRYFSAGQWSAWDDTLGGALNTDPSAVVDGPFINLVALGTNNQVFFQRGLGAPSWWDGWVGLGGDAALAQPAIANRSGSYDVLAVWPDHALHHVVRDANGNWSGWESLAGSCAPVAPAAVSTGGNTLDVVVIGTDGGVYHKRYDGAQWLPSLSGYNPVYGNVFSPSDGSAFAAPSLSSGALGQLDLLVQGTDYGLYYKRFAAGAWASGWSKLSDCVQPLGAAATVSTASGEIQVVADAYGGSIWHQRFGALPSGGAALPECPTLTLLRDGKTLFSVDPSQSIDLSWGAGDLPTASGALTVRYKDKGTFEHQTELLLLSQDPQQRTNTYATHLDEDQAWQDLENGTLPAAALPFYPSPTFDPTHVLSTNFSGLQAMRVYKHGACSQELAIDTNVLATVSDRLWSTFQASVNDGGAEPHRYWSHATSYLGDGSTGGFLLNAYFYIHIWEPLYLDNSLQFNYRYQFRLDDGRLSVTPHLLRYHYDGYDSDDHWGALKAGLENQLPSQLHAQAIQQQAFPLVDTKQVQIACDPAADDPCRGAAAVVAVLVGSGAQAEGLTPDESSRAIATALALESDGVTRHNLRCAPVPAPAKGGRCEYILRAKRLNVYPDTVELVWFDGKEVDNPAYSAYLMTRQQIAPDPSLTNQLCSPLRHWTNSGVFARPFVSQDRGNAP